MTLIRVVYSIYIDNKYKKTDINIDICLYMSVYVFIYINLI